MYIDFNMTPFTWLFCSNCKNTCKYKHEIKLVQSMDDNSGNLWTMQKTIIIKMWIFTVCTKIKEK